MSIVFAPEVRLSAEEQNAIQTGTARSASREGASQELSPTLFIVCSRGFSPLPVPTLSLSASGPIINPAFASHPIWWLRSDIRNARADEDFKTDEGRMLYLARMMMTFEVLELFDGFSNAYLPSLSMFNLFPDRVSFDAEQISLWLKDEGDEMKDQELRRILDNHQIGAGMPNISEFIDESSKAAKKFIARVL